MGIFIKRVYEAADRSDGYRVLVDRIWPRGMTKEGTSFDIWAKELAPSSALRKWFDHDPARWEDFTRRYEAELDLLAAFWRPLLTRAARRRVILVYGARDVKRNQAVVLKAYLEAQTKAEHTRKQRDG